MGDHTNDLSYTDELEQILSSQGERAFCYRWLHEKAECYYSNANHWISLPVIIGSTITGASSIGIGAFFPDARIGSIVIGGVSLAIGALNTVGEYFGYAKRTESHRFAAVNYAKLYRFLQIELALPRHERMVARDLLKTTREQIQRLEEVSPQIPKHIIRLFKRKFPKEENPELSMPESTNGLEPIHVFSGRPAALREVNVEAAAAAVAAEQ